MPGYSKNFYDVLTMFESVNKNLMAQNRLKKKVEAIIN